MGLILMFKSFLMYVAKKVLEENWNSISEKESDVKSNNNELVGLVGGMNQLFNFSFFLK